jgi:hypothetical protein
VTDDDDADGDDDGDDGDYDSDDDGDGDDYCGGDGDGIDDDGGYGDDGDSDDDGDGDIDYGDADGDDGDDDSDDSDDYGDGGDGDSDDGDGDGDDGGGEDDDGDGDDDNDGDVDSHRAFTKEGASGVSLIASMLRAGRLTNRSGIEYPGQQAHTSRKRVFCFAYLILPHVCLFSYKSLLLPVVPIHVCKLIHITCLCLQSEINLSCTSLNVDCSVSMSQDESFGSKTIFLLKHSSLNSLRLNPRSSFSASCSVTTTISVFFSFDEKRYCKKCIWIKRTARTLQMMGPSYPALNACEFKLKEEGTKAEDKS